MAMSHATCDHERTPKARAACRARQRQHDSSVASVREVTPTKIEGLSKVTNTEGNLVDWQVTPELVAKVEAKITKRTKRTDPSLRVADRRMAEICAAADQVTWDGARKAARKAARRTLTGDPIKDCVQAALHVGGGRCACGWEANGCGSCGNSLVNAKITGPNAGGMCGPTYCHYALAN